MELDRFYVLHTGTSWAASYRTLKQTQKFSGSRSMNNSTPGAFIHLGAGRHSEAQKSRYHALCHRALEAALDQTHSALDMVAACISVLENDPLVNCGTGSNLTADGTVECDASIMTSDGSFGAVGAVSGVRNPIKLCAEILQRGKVEGKFGRIPPLMLVGEGARQWARDNCPQDSQCNPAELITPQRGKEFEKFKKMFDSTELLSDDLTQDTVGAVCIDRHGNMASGVSSGGIWLKYPGRVGEAAMYGSGTWTGKNDHVTVGVSISGTGEQIMRTLFSRTIADRIIRMDESEMLDETLRNCLEREFIESPLLEMYSERNIGLILVKMTRLQDEKEAKHNLELAYGFTTASMVVAWQFETMRRPKILLDRKSSERPTKISIFSV